MRNAIVYARFSPRPNGETCESIETQKALCDAACVAKQWTVVETFYDREISGGRMDNRPGLNQALQAVCRHKGVLVVASLSRLARNTRDAIAISEQLQGCGAELFSISESIDTTSPTGRFVFTLFAALAQLERETVGARTKAALLHYQSQGRIVSFKLPYGFKRDPENPTHMIPCEQEQLAIARIHRLAPGCKNSRDICRMLTLEKIPCRGKAWHHCTVEKILANGF